MNECRCRKVSANACCCGKSTVVRFLGAAAFALLLWTAPAYAEKTVHSSIDRVSDQVVGPSPAKPAIQSTERLTERSTGQIPVLGNNRLFISGEQRSLFDKSDVVEAVAPEGLPPEKTEAEIVKQPLTNKIVASRTRVLSLDGLILRPDGSVDVWVNGSLIGKQSNNGIKLVKAAISGPVVLSAHGQRFELYPGQRKIVSLASGVNP